ncbi:O-antigen ligase family protein [Knoellia sp. CPCC 206450]|uniref:O-antigen ligase family protein n=1 Tax=Knoellia tibetensis TaxID=3404798 RepID=UPI003B438E9F
MGRLWRLVAWPGVLALSLLGAWMAWSVASAVVGDGDGGVRPVLPYVLCPLVLVAGVATGAALHRRAHSPAVPVALVVTSTALVLGALLVVDPGKAPLGYPNANAALGVQLVALSGLALLATPVEAARGRVLLALSALAAALAVGLNRSAAGMAVLLAVGLVTLLAVWCRPVSQGWRLAAVVVGAVASVAAGGLIVAAAREPVFPAWARTAFDPAREQLWEDAAALWRQRPLTGSGPGSFAGATSLAADADTVAAHSSVLQVAAETGWVGVGFLALTGLAGLLWAARGRTPEAVVGAAAWAALLVHSTADHLVEFGPVVLLAGAVVGWAGASGRSSTRPEGSEELDVPERERPLPR